VLLGTRPHRLDLVPKTNGTAGYGIDVRVPGMKFASVEKPREIGATLASLDPSDALKVPGVRRVVPISSGVAVVADTTWAAFQGRNALHVTWKSGPNASVSTETLYASARAAVANVGGTVTKKGDALAALGAGKPVTATYEIPYAAHAPMEPMNATADVRADRVTVWAPTQSPVPAQQAAAKASGLPASAVTVQPTLLGGGFGRRLSQDYVTDAVEVSKAAGIPIQVVWTREDDMRNDPYRPGSVNALQGVLAPDGTIAAYRHTLAVQSSNAVRGLALPGGVDPSWLRGTGDFGYAIPNVLVDGHLLDVKIPVGPWRAPAANANTFATESFIDELAHAAGKDPIVFRLAMLERGSRQRTVLEMVAERSKWGTPAPAGRARGVALATWGGSWIAIVAEVSQPSPNDVKVHRMWAAVDCGLPINRDGIETQLTSGMLYGLSAALRGKITFINGVVQQSNFPDYPVLRMNDAPDFDVQIVASTQAPTGAGEIGTPPVPPAVANALFALAGKRVRQLPLLEHLA
jgi:isoquinoline 1-oxidoreductase beta subunit